LESKPHASPYCGLRDEQLWCAYVEGDDAALAEVIRRHGGGLYWYLLSSLVNQQRALDGMMEVLELAAAHRGPHDGFASLKGWLYAIATQKVVPTHRVEEPGLDDPMRQLMMSERAPEKHRRVFALADLQPRLRQPLLLLTQVQLPLEEAARACNYTEHRLIASVEEALRILAKYDAYTV